MKKPTLIHRHRISSNFTIFPNQLIKDERLSWKALGILVFILSYPEHWRLCLLKLAEEKPTGRDATRTGIKELEAAGYVRVIRERRKKGRFGQTIWLVTDDPEQEIDLPAIGLSDYE